MILIADCGSTKADWRLIGENGYTEDFNTRGFNPFLHSSDVVRDALKTELLPGLKGSQVAEIYFYGAGCSDPYRCSIIESALTDLFPKALINVDHDLLAAARATCGEEAGISCILGTGSNSCLYDGEVITDNVTNLGHILGDEGSGYHLGKSLAQAYFYRELPSHLHQAFEDFCPLGKREILNEIYNKGKTNVFLSSFAQFIANHKEDPFIEQLIKEAFEIFVLRHVCKYKDYENLPVSFIGSIAFHFQDILLKVLESHFIQAGVIVKKPIERLVAFHQKSHKITTKK